ncbi:hypothetical protein EKO04_011173 [Ascochyta lentis]|uniref:Uncharacterized protein n=1 Tax=Ascochyta lentis TaxID=205686 RepID=A0A8H7IT76_9PLEO|nr:hypothetical protein EKO04_011173 [Ascochyta lentis]
MTSHYNAPAPQLSFPNKTYLHKATTAVPDRLDTKLPASFKETALPVEIEQRILSIKNIRKMDQQQRAELLQGTTIEILVDNQIVETVPFRLFLAVSSKARQLYMTHDQSIPRNIKFTNLDKDLVRMVIHWVKETSTKHNCFSLNRSQDDDIFKDLALLRAADGLGMRYYVNHIGIHWYKAITMSDRIPTPEEMAAVEEHCPDTVNDKLFKAVAQRVAHCRMDETVSAEHYDRYVATLPKLSATVAEFYQVLAEKKAMRRIRQKQRASAEEMA